MKLDSNFWIFFTPSTFHIYPNYLNKNKLKQIIHLAQFLLIHFIIYIMNVNDSRGNRSSYAIPKTISQSIYNYLKDSIINNSLKANQRLNEKEIARLFEVSTTPVREAVLRLSAEGFVTIDSHRETVVKEISYEELKDIFQVLGQLDSLATCLAADNLSPEDLKDLENLTREMEKNCYLDSTEKYVALNLEIHKKIWKHIPNKVLRSTLHYVHNQMLRYSYAHLNALKKPDVLKTSMREHKDMITALKSRNKKKLKNMMFEHWNSRLQPSSYEEGIREYLTSQRKGGAQRKSEEKTREKGGVSAKPDTPETMD